MAYVDLATLKAALGITDDARNALLTKAIEAAERSITERTGRTFERDEATSARTFRTAGRVARQDDGTELLLVDDIATDEGLVVETGDGSTWATVDASAYEIAPDNALVKGRAIEGLVRISGTWHGSRRVRVTAEWGWPAVPGDIAQAALLQACRLFDRRNSPQGVAGSADWGLVRVPHLDPDVRALIDPYTLPGMG